MPKNITVLQALKEIGVKGGEVVMPALCSNIVLSAVKKSGAKPVFADIDERALCITKESVTPLINEKTRAIIIVGLYGMPAYVRDLKEFNLPIIEDCTENQGSMELPDRGDFICYNPKQEKKGEITKKRRVLTWYGVSERALQVKGPQQMIARVPNSARIVKVLQEKGVKAKVGYRALHKLPVAQKMAKEIILLPTRADMRKEEVKKICNILSLELEKSALRLLKRSSAMVTTQKKESKHVEKSTT